MQVYGPRYHISWKIVSHKKKTKSEMKITAFLKGVIVCSVHLLVLTNLINGWYTEYFLFEQKCHLILKTSSKISNQSYPKVYISNLTFRLFDFEFDSFLFLSNSFQVTLNLVKTFTLLNISFYSPIKNDHTLLLSINLI